MNDKRNREYFKDTFSEIEAPSALVGKVLNMKENENGTVKSRNRKAILLIAATTLVLLATGAAWVVSSLNVMIDDLGMTDEGYSMDIPETEIPEDLRKELEKFELLTDEEMSELEREHAVYMFGHTRLECVAENYGHTYKGRVLYEYIENLGENPELYCEIGAFYNDNGEVFVFCHTNDPDFESHTLVSLFFSNPETKEVKYEHVTFDKVGAYTAVISDDGWNLEGVFMLFMHDDEPIGGHSGLIPGGNLIEKDYVEFMETYHTATVDFIDRVLSGEDKYN